MQASTSPRSPSPLCEDGAGGQQDTATATHFSTIQRLLAEIEHQWEKDRKRVTASGRQSRRHRDDDDDNGLLRRPDATSATGAVTTNDTTTTGSELDDEAASAYWWTDLFLRYFVFDEDCTKTTTAADSDDLLFFVRRQRNKRKCTKHRSLLHRRRVTYETRAYRKQQQQQKQTKLPIGDPSILWRHTVCLNTILHRLRYTFTLAVCKRLPRRSTNHCSRTGSFEPTDDNYDYDLQVLSRQGHTVYASTSGRRMDAAKASRERPVYPAVCWTIDDFQQMLQKVAVRPGELVCVELVATWCDPVDDVDSYDIIGSNWALDFKPLIRQNRAVLYSGAIPYVAVRAAYECKMSLYRNVERQRRKRCRQQQRKRGGKKSSLGAALSASLSALFVSGSKDSTPSLDCGDYDYNYGSGSSANLADLNRIEYVTVRGCRPSCYNDDSGGELSSDDENRDGDYSDFVGNDTYSYTKGIAQMAVTLATKPVGMIHLSFVDDPEDNDYYKQDYGDGVKDFDFTDDPDYNTNVYYDQYNDDYTPVIGYQQEQIDSYTTSATTSEPGDYYDYEWDYETAASSEQQTPQTPSYYYQQQQQQQLERQRRRGGKPRRLSDPCSTSVFDQLDNNDHSTEQYFQLLKQQHEINNYSIMYEKKNRRKQQNNYQNQIQQQLNTYRSVRGLSSVASTPGRSGKMQHPHRAWSESDGLDQYGGSFVQQIQNQQKPQLLLPPTVPYYYADEAAESGFSQYVRKSQSGWWTHTKNKQRRRRYKNMKRKQSGKTNTSAVDRRRSSSAGPNGYTITDDENSDGLDSGSNSDHGESNSDEQDSDGEFIGVLAAAAAFGQDPDREWLQRGNDGDPVADWDRYDCESNSSAESNDDNMVEWTAEIVATNIRYKQPDPTCSTNGSSRIVHENSLQQSVGRSQQFYRQLPRFQPEPLPPQLQPTLCVAFTSVACPWWTVLKDVLRMNPKALGEKLSSNKIVTELPLLTFD